jgi:hypothetical protein
MKKEDLVHAAAHLTVFNRSRTSINVDSRPHQLLNHFLPVGVVVLPHLPHPRMYTVQQ